VVRGHKYLGAGGLDTGKDNDIITGTGFWSGLSISPTSFLNTGDGNDTITGNNTAYATALTNSGVIDTGEGDDIITGTNIDRADGYVYPVSSGLSNNAGGEFHTGDGNDTITGISTTQDGIGFANNNTIDTGNDNDIITGTGKNLASSTQVRLIRVMGQTPSFLMESLATKMGYF
jgi:Ca2+-binding RTX toxin-like protein